MNYKSYILEDNFNSFKNNILLFYGENEGLKKDFKNQIKSLNSNASINYLSQEEILADENNLYNKIFNKSLFDEKEIFLIENVTDKILEIVKTIENKIEDHKIYFFSQVLDKKSKLRAYFEKSKELGIVACYNDNYISLRKIILKKLKGYTGLTPEIINLIINNTHNDRVKLNNELNKIKIYFIKKVLSKNELDQLLNIAENQDFEAIKDSAFFGDKERTNKLLSDTIISQDKSMFYLNNFNARLYKLMEIYKLNTSVEKAIELLKPPVFWKDKPNIIEQAKKWNPNKVQELLKKTFEMELSIKRTSLINSNTLIKKLVIDTCELANAS